MRDIIKYFDKFTFSIIILLTITSIVLIYSASHSISKPFHSKQIVWLIISSIAFLIVFNIKTEFTFKSSIFIYIILVVILFFQILVGKIIFGTKSWVRIGILSIQFSEFIKIPLALIVARLLTKYPNIGWKTFFKLVILIGIPFTIIAIQPDLGTAFILTSFLLISIILKRIKRSIIIFSLLIILSGSIFTWNYVLKPYQKNRIISFLNPGKYQKSSGYQIIQSKIAIGSGGLKGKGYLKGSQSEYRFLPTQHTDFIFSVLGEEFGFFGISFLFILFFLLFYRQFNFKTEAAEEFYFVYLFNGLILFQFLINILMSIGLLPILGVPLPFISYGGSSLLSFFIGEAIIFKIKINSYLK